MKMNSGATIAKPKAITKEIHSTTFNVLVDISFLENNFSTTELLLLLKHNINFHLLLQTEVSLCKMLHLGNVHYIINLPNFNNANVFMLINNVGGFVEVIKSK